MVNTISGNEIFYGIEQDANGRPAAQLIPFTSQQIANLNGSGSYRGTFTVTGATAVSVTNTLVLTTSPIVISLNTVGGTVGALPTIKTITAASGFTVKADLADTSTYNYAILGTN